MTEPVPVEMAAALVAALGDLDELARDKTATVPTKTGGSYSYSYTDLGSVLGYVRPILKQHGLAMLTPLTCDGQTVTVHPSILHTSGARVEFPPFSLPAGRTPQETGSAATYARRYSVLAVLNLATEDDDGAKATEGARRQAEPAAQPEPDLNKRFVDLGWADMAEHDAFRRFVRDMASSFAEDWAEWWKENQLRWPLHFTDKEKVELKLAELNQPSLPGVD